MLAQEYSKQENFVTTLEEFFAEFDEKADRLLDSRHQDFAAAAGRFLSLLEDAPEGIAGEVLRLKGLFSIERVRNEVLVHAKVVANPARINWPYQLDASLGGRLNLLVSLSKDSDAASRFAHKYFYSGTNDVSLAVRQIQSAIVEPFVFDLRHHLLSRGAGIALPGRIPASDRTVLLSHNSLAHVHAASAIAEVAEKLRQTNLGDPEEKERVVAELNAGLQLLKAAKLRISAFAGLVVGALSWVTIRFAETAVGQAAIWAVDKVLEYLPMLASFF
jgi:hypothetical protein